MFGKPTADFCRALVGSSTVALIVLDDRGVIQFCTPEATRMVEGVGADVVGRMFSSLFPVEGADAASAYAGRLLSEEPGRSFFFEGRCVLADGDVRWLEFTGVNLLSDPAVRGAVLNLADRTELVRFQTEAVTDHLTGLANRRAAFSRLRTAKDGVVIMIDIDRFKAINDVHGHQFGDEVLVSIARRLTPVFGALAQVGRLGGDEFVIVLPESAVDRAWQLTELALASIEAPIGSGALRVTASAGITQIRAGDGDVALERADQGLYRAKAAGRARVCAPADEEPAWEERRRSNGSALEQALRREAKLKSENALLSDQMRWNERTGLLSAEAYERDLEAIDTVARYEDAGYALALCDIDYFGLYNNRYGYSQANQVLRAVADALKAACRPGDLVYRYGGEELVVVLRDATLEDASDLAERLRAAVEALEIPHESRPEHQVVTITVGVAALNKDRHQNPRDVFDEANSNLREAKGAGRNRVNPAPAASAR